MTGDEGLVVKVPDGHAFVVVETSERIAAVIPSLDVTMTSAVDGSGGKG